MCPACWRDLTRPLALMRSTAPLPITLSRSMARNNARVRRDHGSRHFDIKSSLLPTSRRHVSPDCRSGPSRRCFHRPTGAERSSAGQKRPDDTGGFVRLRDRCHARRLALQQAAEPGGSLLIDPARFPDQPSRAHNKQTPEVPISLFGDSALALLAAAAVLFWCQSDPGGEVTRRTELTLIGHLRGDRGRRDRTHARDGGEPAAGLVVPMPGDDGSLNLLYPLAQF